MILFYLVIVVVIIIICAGTLVKEMIRSFRKKNAVLLVKKNEEIKYYICIILYKYVLVLLNYINERIILSKFIIINIHINNINKHLCNFFDDLFFSFPL